MWQVIPGQCLQFRAWDDEFVLYNDLSGDTHLLGAGAIELLLSLQQTPSDAAALAQALGAAPQAEQLAALLADLARLSLIEPIGC
jgi:PqqD family protein of HPr-rel-A system